MSVARIDGSFIRLLKQLAKTELLILDDFGLEPLKQTPANHRMAHFDW